MTRTGPRARICGRGPARISSRYDRNRSLRSAPSAPLCPSGYDTAAALARGARSARGHFHCGAGPRIRPPGHPLRCHHRPVRAAQPGAADGLQPDAAAGTGLCRGLAGVEHRRTGRTAVLHRRPAESVFISVSCPRADLGDGAADQADDRARGARDRMRLRAGLLPYAAAVGGRGAAGAAANLPVRGLALDPGGDWRHQSLRIPGHRGGPQTVGRAGCYRTGADPGTTSHAAGWSGRRRRARTRNAALDHLPDFARTGAERE